MKIRPLSRYKQKISHINVEISTFYLYFKKIYKLFYSFLSFGTLYAIMWLQKRNYEL